MRTGGNMQYKLEVTRRVENPKYQGPKYPGNYYGPEECEFFDTRILVVDLTEKEYTAIKKAVIEVIN